MNSKERVLTAFARREPDRVPVNYMANPGIDRRLKQHFGLVESDGEGLLQALGVDFRSVNPEYTGPQLHADVPGRQVDIWGLHTRWVEHESGGYWDFCDFPLRDATLEDIEAWPMPSPDDFNYQRVADRARQWRDYAVVLGGPGQADIINKTGMIRGVEQTMIDLATEDPVFLMYNERRVNVQLDILRRALETAKGAIDALWMGEDLGSQIGPLIGLDMYRRLLRPFHQRFVDLGKAYGIPVMIHTCGSSSWAYDDFIEMGVGVVDTLQPEARDMAPAYLKKRFGHKLAFHGCISTAGPVAYGKPQDVARSVRETLQVMMPGGGYALAPTHQLQDNSPTENVVAMYDAARKYGTY